MSNDTCNKKELQWKCVLCGFQNSKYLPRCEECLSWKSVQNDPQSLQQLYTALDSVEEKHLYGKDIVDITTKIKGIHQTFLKNAQQIEKGDQSPIQNTEKELKQLFMNANLKYDPNLVHEFLQTSDQKHFKKQQKIQKNCSAICRCGTEMIKKKENKCYNDKYMNVICDICNNVIPSNKQIIHCPRKHIKLHPDGFDICQPCKKLNTHRLRRFVALIVCPKMTKGNHNNKDAVELVKLFDKLGFHETICLDDDKATAKSFEKAMDNIIPKKNGKENVNQFTVICYSGHGFINSTFKYGLIFNKYHFDLNPPGKNEPCNYLSSDVLKVLFGSKADGLKFHAKEMFKNVYYGHNALLLINSCHSGGARRPISAQNIIDGLGMSASVIVAVAAFLGISSFVILGCLAGCATEIEVNAKLAMMKAFGVVLKKIFGIKLAAFCAAMNPIVFYVIAGIAGISLLSAILIVVSISKSKKCQSVAVIASCGQKQETITKGKLSYFVKYVIEYFNGVLSKKNIQPDTPMNLYKSIKIRYKEPIDELGGYVCWGKGKEFQKACYAKRGFDEFALCPLFVKKK